MDDDKDVIPCSSRIKSQLKSDSDTQHNPDFNSICEETDNIVIEFQKSLRVQIIKGMKIGHSCKGVKIQQDFIKSLSTIINALQIMDNNTDSIGDILTIISDSTALFKYATFKDRLAFTTMATASGINMLNVQNTPSGMNGNQDLVLLGEINHTQTQMHFGKPQMDQTPLLGEHMEGNTTYIAPNAISFASKITPTRLRSLSTPSPNGGISSRITRELHP